MYVCFFFKFKERKKSKAAGSHPPAGLPVGTHVCPMWLAQQFALAWGERRFKCGLEGQPNDEEDWVRFGGEYTDVYMRFMDKKLTLAMPASTHFLIIEMGSIADVVRFLIELEITLQTIPYKYEADVFSHDTYQFRAPCTSLKIDWKTTYMPDVPKRAFECDFTLPGVDVCYPPGYLP